MLNDLQPKSRSLIVNETIHSGRQKQRLPASWAGLKQCVQLNGTATYSIVLSCTAQLQLYISHCTALLQSTALFSTIYASMDSTLWHCIVLHLQQCLVLHGMASHCSALYSVQYCIALHCIALRHTELSCTVLHCTVQHCVELYCTALRCTALCGTMLQVNLVQYV